LLRLLDPIDGYNDDYIEVSRRKMLCIVDEGSWLVKYDEYGTSA